ncbi:hypothetical protein DEO72_LG6g1397 [Vigna unguiculata]|uniref:Uncharacterized protein n=1 Tax=Vigna unguiculata TaxID=3917 RepID=A0A4D6M5N3_VIGUN|nr:hypothetical protein DEO72_LG6g1397 [Vigna unguiculata]
MWVTRVCWLRNSRRRVADYVRIWELHLALRCVIRSMVSARALSVVADRTGMRFPNIPYYTWWWPCGGKVTSLPRGVSMYMVVVM